MTINIPRFRLSRLFFVMDMETYVKEFEIRIGQRAPHVVRCSVGTCSETNYSKSSVQHIDLIVVWNRGEKENISPTSYRWMPLILR